MHKSKNYDMATQVAMEKLMPKSKPKVQVTISMQDGDGLTGLREGGPVIRRYMGGGYGSGHGAVDAAIRDFNLGQGTDTDTRTTVRNAPTPVRIGVRPRRPIGPKLQKRYSTDQEPPEANYRDPAHGIWGLNEQDILNPQGWGPYPQQGYFSPEAIAKREGYSSDDIISEKDFMKGFQHTAKHFGPRTFTEERNVEIEDSVKDKIAKGRSWDLFTPLEKEVARNLLEDSGVIPRTLSQTDTYYPPQLGPDRGTADKGLFLKDFPVGPAIKPGQNVVGLEQSALASKFIRDDLRVIQEKLKDAGLAKEDVFGLIEKAVEGTITVKEHDKLRDEIPSMSKLETDALLKAMDLVVQEKARRWLQNIDIRASTGGGISSLQESININGQPHRLVWVNPEEEGVLKDMGGSGKKVNGIPAYYYGSFGSSPEAEIIDYDLEEASTGDIDLRSGMSAHSPEMRVTGELPDDWKSSDLFDIALDPERPTITSTKGKPKLRRRVIPKVRRIREDDPSGIYKYGEDIGKFLKHDPLTISEAEREAYNKGFDAWRAGPGAFSLDAPKDYMDWFNQNRDAMREGIELAIGPTGHAIRTSLDLINQQLQNRFQKARAESEEDVALSGGWETDELTREELQDTVKDIDGLEDFEPYDGLRYPAWMPGGLAGQALNFFSRTVIGTGTVNGVRVHVHEDGTVTPISYEDTPGFDYSKLEVGDEPIVGHKPKSIDVSSVTKTDEPSPLESLLTSRSDASPLAKLNEKMQERVNKFYNRNIFT